MSTVPTTEPLAFTAGDTIAWSKSFADYKASAGWALTYVLATADTSITLTAASAGDGFLITETAATTADWPAGAYTWHAYVTKGAERYTVGYGSLTLHPNYAIHSSGYDARSHVKKVLDALEAMLENKATQDQLSYSIGTGNSSRTLARLSPEQVLVWYDKYKILYSNEQKAERIAKGLGHKGTIKVRFA